MQETLTKQHNLSPANASVELIRFSKNTEPRQREVIKNQIIDEEMTHASEILASISGEADIPRIYYEAGNDLVDPYGVSLVGVLKNGIDYLESSNNKRSGWQWELRRRKIEQVNLEKIINAPQGVACVEISPTDLAKPSHELREQGYAGDTLVRISYKNSGQVIQRNIIIGTSDLNILNTLRNKLEKGTAPVSSAEESLARIIFVPVDYGNLESFISEFKNFATLEISKNSPAKYLSSLIKKYLKQKQNAWEIVKANKDIFEDLYIKFEQLSDARCVSADEVNLIRAGVWQNLISGASSRNNRRVLGSIDEGIALARSAGTIFTSCGGTVTFAPKANSFQSIYFNRYDTAKMLMNKINGYGVCQSCGSVGLMYGCGVYCWSCNCTWCEAYVYTGRQLSNKEISEKKYRSIFKLWLF